MIRPRHGKLLAVYVIIGATIVLAALLLVRSTGKSWIDIYADEDSVATDRINELARAIGSREISSDRLLELIRQRMGRSGRTTLQADRNTIATYALRSRSANDEDLVRYATSCWRLVASRDMDGSVTVLITIPFNETLLVGEGVSNSSLGIVVNKLSVTVNETTVTMQYTDPSLGTDGISHLFHTGTVSASSSGSRIKIAWDMHIVERLSGTTVVELKDMNAVGTLVEAGSIDLAY